MYHNITYETEKILLRPLSSQDSERYRQLRNREENRNCFLTTAIISPSQQETWYKSYLEKKNDYMFSVYDKTEQFLGAAALYNIHDLQAEFGRLLIDEELAKGRGLGYDVLQGLIVIARKNLHLTLLYLTLLADNLPALKTYEKAGFILKRKYVSNTPSLSEKLIYYMEKPL